MNGASPSDGPVPPKRADREIERDPSVGNVSGAFERGIDEGADVAHDVARLIATGAVGGFDVGVGVLALLIVREATGSVLLGSSSTEGRRVLCAVGRVLSQVESDDPVIAGDGFVVPTIRNGFVSKYFRSSRRGRFQPIG